MTDVVPSVSLDQQHPHDPQITNNTQQPTVLTSLTSSLTTPSFVEPSGNYFAISQTNNNPSNMQSASYYNSLITVSSPPPPSTSTSNNQSSPVTDSRGAVENNTSPPTPTYSYSGPPKSYYSRLPLYDRPFKCDQCPQSFNRNHDLKRHKRIHLAIKPYPCQSCEKQFSRKDALKRHCLVKGCNR
ncbi:6833_t:CDS:2 [Diversispora eburnea]|uniref:6833_t:CDS:1 n=1 Tax=Diversispora eburnea TaxID=1213867 RepID=A0A9N9A764_9GLOM|nr:6833_t:CDS:2 [Diversispora eburnea]